MMTFKSKLIAGLAAASDVLLEKLDDLQIHMTGAETEQSGHAFTRANSLASYERALGQLLKNVKTVRGLAADHPNQQRSLDRLESLIAAKLDELQDRIQVRNQQGLLPKNWKTCAPTV
jgi:CHASE3 domain sensor protein